MLKTPPGLLIEVTWCERNGQERRFWVVGEDEANAILFWLNRYNPEQGCRGRARDVTTGREIKLKNLY